MATSGSSSMSFNSGHHRFIVEWSTKSQSVPNNNSLVNVKVFLQSVDQWGAFYAPASNSGSLTVNGSTTKWTATSNLSANQKKLLFAKDYTIGHNSDGTKAFSFSSSYTVNVTYSGVYLGLVQTGSNGTLNTIPRKSDVALSSANINFGDSTTIKVTKKSSGFTSTLRFNWSSSQQTIASKTASTSVTFTPDKSLMQYISSSKDGWGTVYCDTYSGNTLIGTNSVKLTINVPNNSSYTPIISNVILSENNSAVTTAVGAVYLQDKSRVKVTTTASGQGYSTIASVAVKLGTNSTFTGNPAISGAITETGTSLPVVVTVTDSRGYIATNSQTIAILPYTNPTSTIKVARREAEQEIVDIVWSGKTKAVGTANTMGYKLEYRIAGGTWTSIATGNNATTETWGATKTQAGIAIDKAHEFRINVYDEFMTSQATQSISVATVPMAWGKKGSSVGKVYQEGGATFQVSGSTETNTLNVIDKETVSLLEVTTGLMQPLHRVAFKLPYCGVGTYLNRVGNVCWISGSCASLSVQAMNGNLIPSGSYATETVPNGFKPFYNLDIFFETRSADQGQRRARMIIQSDGKMTDLFTQNGGFKSTSDAMFIMGSMWFTSDPIPS